MHFKWITLIFIVLITGQSGYGIQYSKLYDKQIKIDKDINGNETNTVCLINNPSYYSAIVCPTDIDCYFVSVSKSRINQIDTLKRSYNLRLDSPCMTWNNGQLSVNKTKQVNAVLQILQLTNQTVCEFSSMEAFYIIFDESNNTEQVGSGNCDEISKCPYNLKNLIFEIVKIDYLLNNSFCQFKKLEFLALGQCGLRAIEEDAFVHLIHLEEIYLGFNRLTHLPSNLFSHNTHLQIVNLVGNQLQVQALNAFFPIKSLLNLLIANNNINFDNSQIHFPTQLEQLVINGNKLKSIKLEFKNLQNLTYLLLWNSSLKKIHENAFQSLIEVKFMDLSHNQIEHLHPNLFRNTDKLEELWLQNNSLIDFPSIAHLKNLRKFSIANNEIRFINKTHLSNCRQLSEIYLFINELSFIEAGSFDNIIQLQILNLFGNRLTQSTVNFTNSNILKIDLGFNNFTSFSYDIFPPSVNVLSLYQNQIETIEDYDFNDQNQWNLTQLYLNNNRITSIASLKLPPSIQGINLNDNEITEILTLAEISKQGLRQLRYVYLRQNQITSICEFFFFNFRMNFQISYYVSGNPLKCTCENNWLKYPQTSAFYKFEDINNVQCQSMNPYDKTNTFIAQTWDEIFLCQSNQTNSNRCQCVQSGNMQCELQCPTNCTCLSDYFQTNIYFMCNSQSFTNVPSDLKYDNRYYVNSSAIALDFSGNFIPHVHKLDFGNFSSKFKRLSLYNSSIKSIDQNAFDELINLQLLSLASNQLEILPDQIFSKLTKLTFLTLSNNHLTNLADDTFSSQTNLRYLYLYNNNLSRIQLNQISQLKNMSNIALDGNPWSCECTFIEPFRALLADSSMPIYLKLELNCTENGEQFNVLNFDMEKCSQQIQRTIFIVSLTFGITIAITVGLVFKWRYELQVLVYARYGLRVFHKKPTEEDITSKQYDAFVAYNSEDMDFLINELMPGLEKIENSYRLCIHQRDFPVGAIIQDSILDAISMSSRTIVILSENFVSSGWCRFEFKSAHMQMLQDRCPRVLVILVGEVPGTLDPEMKLYLQTNTYLKWGEKLFWQKLYYAMPDKRVTTPATDIMPMRDF